MGENVPTLKQRQSIETSRPVDGTMRKAPGGLLAAIAVAFCVTAAGPSASAQSSDPIKIVVMNDQSSAYADHSGIGSVITAKMAVEDFGGKVMGRPIEVIGLDHQLKADIAATQARKAIDIDKVSAFFDMSNSSVSLAVQDVVEKSDRIVVHVGTALADLFGKACSPNGALWLYDTTSLARGLVEAQLDDQHKDWFLLSADYAFGHLMEKNLTDAIVKRGGRVVGAVRHPINSADFSSFLLQAIDKKPQVLALLNAGNDTTTAMKQAAEFGLVNAGIQVSVPIFTIMNVSAIGPQAVKGTRFLEGYYWDRDAESRAFGKRFMAITKRAPTQMQAAVYSAVLHYLKAVEASKAASGVVVMNKMKEIPVNDFMTKNAKLRADGRLMRDLLLLEAKGPDEVKGEWDLMKVKSVLAADKIIPEMDASTCKIVKAKN